MTPRYFLFATLLAALATSACGNADAPSDAGASLADIERSDDNHDDHDHDDHDGEDGEGDHDAHDEHEDEDHSDDHDHNETELDEDDHGHGDDAHDDDSDHVELSPSDAAEAGIVVSRVEHGTMRPTVSLPAEIRYDGDRIAAVSPQVSGRITRLIAGEGDEVARGAALAVLASRELAELKAAFLTAVSAEDLAQQALTREETLFADRITSEADLQTARAALIAARANREGIENKLHAVGVRHSELGRLANATDGTLANVTLTAPISGIVARRTATLGATVSADDPSAPPLFTIVDDSVLWADISVYNQDAGSVHQGAAVILRSDTGLQLADGEIAVVLPAIDETSRTATARMIVRNDTRRLRPGQFVTADIAAGTGEPALQVLSSAIVEVEGRASVFVPTDDGYQPRAIEQGSEFSGQTSILSGLQEGEQYVSEGAFTLKAQLEKDAFGDGHEH